MGVGHSITLGPVFETHTFSTSRETAEIDPTERAGLLTHVSAAPAELRILSLGYASPSRTRTSERWSRRGIEGSVSGGFSRGSP